MKQLFHSIIKPCREGGFVGWIEEIPGAITSGSSVQECRSRLCESLRLLIETNRHEAQLWADDSCMRGVVEIDSGETPSVH